MLGGGQDASAVTTTDHRAGKFEAKFFDKVRKYIALYILVVLIVPLVSTIKHVLKIRSFLCFLDSSRRNRWRQRALWTN